MTCFSSIHNEYSPPDEAWDFVSPPSQYLVLLAESSGEELSSWLWTHDLVSVRDQRFNAGPATSMLALGDLRIPSDGGPRFDLAGCVGAGESVARLSGYAFALPPGGGPPQIFTPIPPAPLPTKLSNVLGCGVYELYALTRGGRSIVGQLPFSELTWGRVLNDTSDCSVTIGGLYGPNRGCCDLLGSLRPWKHELAVFRNGKRVWAGPIARPVSGAGGGGATILARDVTAWWDKRLLVLNHVYGQVDVAFLFKAFSDDAMGQDNSPGLVLEISEAQVLGQHDVLASQHLLAGPELRQLADIGVDWTALDRQVLAGGFTVPVDALTTMLDQHFVASPQVILDGIAQENQSGVRGAGVGAAGDDIYGEYRDDASIVEFGLLANVVSNTAAGTNVSALAAAQSRNELFSEPVAVIESGDLTYGAPFTIDQLVPGAVAPVKLSQTCFAVDATFRIGSVQVRATAAEGGGGEQITVNFMPLGTVFRKHHRPPKPLVGAA